jgi:hypothetical protein
MGHVDECKSYPLLSFQILRLVEVIVMTLEFLVNQSNHIRLVEVVDWNVSDHQRGEPLSFGVFPIQDPVDVYLVVLWSLLNLLFFLLVLLNCSWRNNIVWAGGALLYPWCLLVIQLRNNHLRRQGLLHAIVLRRHIELHTAVLLLHQDLLLGLEEILHLVECNCH